MSMHSLTQSLALHPDRTKLNQLVHAYNRLWNLFPSILNRQEAREITALYRPFLQHNVTLMYLQCICQSCNATAKDQEIACLDSNVGKLCWLVVKLGYAGIKTVLKSSALDLLCSGSNIDSLVELV